MSRESHESRRLDDTKLLLFFPKRPMIVRAKPLNGVADGSGEVTCVSADRLDDLVALGGTSNTNSGVQFSAASGLGLDVVGQVVAVGAAGVAVASGDGVTSASPELLDTSVVVGVDNGRDVIPDDVCLSEVDLAEHTWDVRSALVDGIEVADEALACTPGNGGLGWDRKSRCGTVVASVASEVDGLGNAVEVGEGDGVGDCKAGKGSTGEDA